MMMSRWRLAVGPIAAVLFWLAFGPELQVGPYPSAQGWHAIRFAPWVTALIAAAVGLGVAGLVAVARRMARR
jgi:hypothetical protein